MGSLRLGNSLARFFCHPIAQAQKKPPNPSGPFLFILLCPPSRPSRRGARAAAVAAPPRHPPPPSRRGRPPEAAPRSGAGGAHSPTRPAPPARGRPAGPGTGPGTGSCPPPRRGPTGPLRPLPAPGSPSGLRRAALVKERGDSRPTGAAPSRRPCPHPRGRRAVQGEPGCTTAGVSPSAGERCPGPGPLPAPAAAGAQKSPARFAHRDPGPSAGPDGAGAASGLGRALPQRDPAPVSLVGAKSRREWGLENGFRCPPGLALAALSAAPAAPPVGARGARGCSRRCRGQDKGDGEIWLQREAAGTSEGMFRGCPAAPEEREGEGAVPRGAEPERCRLHPHVRHRVRHCPARRCLPGYSGEPAVPCVPQPSAGEPSATAGPLYPAPTPAAPRRSPGERGRPGFGAAPSGTGSARGSRPGEGWRAGPGGHGTMRSGSRRGLSWRGRGSGRCRSRHAPVGLIR